MKAAFVFVCMCSLMHVLADSEHVVHGSSSRQKNDHYKDGQHDTQYDHDAILGSHDLEDEFDELSPQESKDRLRKMAELIDTDHNDIVTREELGLWIKENFNNLDFDETEQEWDDFDIDGNEQLVWEEWLEKSYDYTPEDVVNMHLDEDKDMSRLGQQIKIDEERFSAADKNGDGWLSAEEYDAVLHPEKYEFMLDIEMRDILFEHDQNDDGVVTFQEYLGESGSRRSKESQAEEKSEFDNLDLNNDGSLDRDEVRKWALPSQDEMVEHETDHLITETDKNDDGVLSYDEIVTNYDTWVGSSVTDFGQHLHDPSEL